MFKTDNFKTLPKIIVNLFFIIGIIAAISFRILIVFQYYQKTLTRPVWYIGITGYFFFFLYRFIISRKRTKIIKQNNLLEKLKAGEKLNDYDREAALYILSSINKSKEKYNYYIIFVLSIIAVCFDLIADFLS